VQGRRTTDENHFCAAAARRLGQRETHLAAGTVADEAHRVECLARAARSDEDHLATQIVTAAKGFQHGFGNRSRLCHAPCADHAAGQVAGSRIDDAHAALAKDFKIGLRGWMVPHVHVHGRRYQHRRGGGEKHRGEKIVGETVRKFGQNVGCGGSHYERVGPLRFSDVIDAVLLGGIFRAPIFPKAGDHFVPGERGKGERLDEFLRRCRHHHVHFHRLALQGAHQFGRFVRGDASGDAHGDSHDVDCSAGDRWQVSGFRCQGSVIRNRPSVVRAEMQAFCSSRK